MADILEPNEWNELHKLLWPDLSQILVPTYRTLERSEELLEEMQKRGFWCQERSPWIVDRDGGTGSEYRAGLTPHGATGWNGSPDHIGYGKTRVEARVRAVLELLRNKAAEVRDGE